jgi:demethylmenaquinone methyltransferase/2-methoxy-6-polyprenyl-1,4-benzoquinol methylase
MCGDALSLLPGLGRFHLIFADAPAGKWVGLDRTIDALETGGLVLVDDMNPPEWVDTNHRDNTLRVRHELLTDDRLLTAELDWASGVMLAVKRNHG